MDLVKVSRKLSYILRHRPDSVGITLSPDGWVEISTLLAALAKSGTSLTRAELGQVVSDNDKKRFAIEGDRIRASQGHSVEVDLGYAPAVPPAVLYHGTATRHLASINGQGLIRGDRHHVHLSADTETAHKVGSRHGKPVILTVGASAMVEAGHAFFISANGVWLTKSVPRLFLFSSSLGLEN
jgi:putative RNA 2'-phosphotransferase